MEPIVDVRADAAAVAGRVAEWLLERALAAPGRFAWCLSGGSTPKATYDLLAAYPFRGRFPWSLTHIFFTDERFVPYDHPDSNYRMVHDTMLAHVAVPPAQVHPWRTDIDPDRSALMYSDMLKAFYGSGTLDPARPLFDVTFLGLGEDGHTASLFPGAAALDERTAWTAAVIGAKPEARLTLTYPTLDSSGVVAFIAVGGNKRAMMERVLAGDATLPAHGVKSVGEQRWFTDQPIAQRG